MSESQTRVVTRKVLAGLSYLHSNGIAHRDIKVGGILGSESERSGVARQWVGGAGDVYTSSLCEASIGSREVS